MKQNALMTFLLLAIIISFVLRVITFPGLVIAAVVYLVYLYYSGNKT